MAGIRTRIGHIEARLMRGEVAARQLASRVTDGERARRAADIMRHPPRSAAHARIHEIMGCAAARRSRDVRDLV